MAAGIRICKHKYGYIYKYVPIPPNYYDLYPDMHLWKY